MIWTLLFTVFGVLNQITAVFADENEERVPSWYWQCLGDKCERFQSEAKEAFSCESGLDKDYPSLSVCRLVCDQYGALWPRPSLFTRLGTKVHHLNPDNIHFKTNSTTQDAQDFISENVEIFKNNILKECPKRECIKEGLSLDIILNIRTEDLVFNWETDEDYQLYLQLQDSSNIQAEIIAQNVFGVRHGLETLSQLVASYSMKSEKCGKEAALVILESATIKDKPVYPHRGLLLDTARNFLSVAGIKKQIDALSSSKMNVLHWHVTDSQSFPLESKSVPQLTRFGAYSKEQIYRSSEVADLIKYAKLRGVRIIIEIDAPAHAGNGWQWGPSENLGNLAVCVNQNPWRSYCIQPPCGQLNPINRNMYTILGKLYGDILEMLPKNEAFHMGGDEVFVPCWNTTDEIIQYLANSGKGRSMNDFLDLWGTFQKLALKQYDKSAGHSNTPVIVWSSHLTDPAVITKYLDNERFVIQTWVPSYDPIPDRLLELKYKLIISTKDAWYLDHGVWGGTQYHNWQTAYNNRIPEKPNVLGGEACSWSEYVDDAGIDARIWPRTAAVAERLWSNPKTTHVVATPRFMRHRQRLLTRGISAGTEGPGWCLQNEGLCP